MADVEEMKDHDWGNDSRCINCGAYGDVAGVWGLATYEALTRKQCPAKLPADASPSEPQEQRLYPTGGDPKDFCTCDHHEMCHANYAGMCRACNQTGCECRDYQPEAAPTAAGSEGPQDILAGDVWHRANENRTDAICNVAKPYEAITTGKYPVTCPACLALLAAPVASQAPAAPKRPSEMYLGNGKQGWNYFAPAPIKAYMDYLESRVRELETALKLCANLLQSMEPNCDCIACTTAKKVLANHE